MRKRDPDPTGNQSFEAPRNRRKRMAGDKEYKQPKQQFFALNFTGEHHHRQRHRRHDPRIDRQHPSRRCGRDTKITRNIRQQANGHKFSGIKDKRAKAKRYHARIL